MKSGFTVTKRDVIEVKESRESNKASKGVSRRSYSVSVERLTTREINESWQKALKKH